MNAAALEFPRRHLPPNVDFGSWAAVEGFYRELLERPIGDAGALERWLLDWSEIDSAFEEEGTSRQIAMTCATDDAEREKRFLDFVENVRPQREPWHDQLRRRLVELAGRFSLPQRRYEVLLRSVRNSCELYREENIPLQVEDAKLAQQYQKTTGAMSVKFRGQELTLQQASRHLEETDRATREEAWRLVSDRYLQDAATLDDIYSQMVAVRDKTAHNAGFPDFRAYAFRAMERFDYSPQDCLAFHDAIEKVVVPAVQQLAADRRKKLGLSTLRPWDTAVDPDQRPPLRPFTTDEQLITGCSRIFHKVNGDLGKQFDTLRERGSLDLGSRKGKAPGGYQAMYHERRLPFIFMNAVGTEGDVRTLLHEGGHAFHSWACRNDPLLPYRTSPIEFAEVASMGMECLSLPHWAEMYGEETPRARKRFFREIVSFFPWMARVDGMQHYVYTHPQAGIENWKDQWQALTRRFAPHIDYSGLERADRHSWHQKLHFFEVPFYYVEYGIAQLGALQVWLNSRRDFEQAVAFYRNGLTLGGARPLPELFEAAGCKFDFSEKTLRPLIEAVMNEVV